MEKILITGSHGFVANHLRLNTPRNILPFFTSRTQDLNVDSNLLLTSSIQDSFQLEEFIVNNGITSIIHCSGNANVDSVEQDIVQGLESNLVTTINLVNIAKKYNLYFVFLSSNAIFDGENPLYNELSIPNPLNKYGLIKLSCEEIIKNSIQKYAIIRPILTYGWNVNNTRANPVTFVINSLRNNKKIKMVTDIYENPVHVSQVVELIWKVVTRKFQGIIHVSGNTILNRFELAIEVAKEFSLDETLIEKSSIVDFKHLAPRPLNTSFNNDKLISIFSMNPLPIKDGLRLMRSDFSK